MKVSITEARDRLADIANRADLLGERIVVERRGRRLCAIVSVEDLEILERLEEAIDIETARSRSSEELIPWSAAKQTLGL